MPSLVHANRVIDELYRDNPGKKIPKQKIYEAASKASIVPDLMTYFSHLPDREFTRQELIDQLNSEVRARGRADEVGLFGKGKAERQAEQGR
jgi:hypothetical protein